MARVIEFFPRQTLIGDDGAAADYYSEIYEVAEVDKIVAELRAFAVSTGGTVTATIEECSDPHFPGDSWSTLTADGNGLSLSADGRDKDTYSDPQRFIRAKISITADKQACVSLVGVCREST